MKAGIAFACFICVLFGIVGCGKQPPPEKKGSIVIVVSSTQDLNGEKIEVHEAGSVHQHVVLSSISGQTGVYSASVDVHHDPGEFFFLQYDFQKRDPSIQWITIRTPSKKECRIYEADQFAFMVASAIPSTTPGNIPTCSF